VKEKVINKLDLRYIFMKAALLYQPKDIRIEEVDIIPPGEKDLLVEVSMAGICGSDFHRYTGDRPVKYYPIILGHEFTGIVKQIGSQVKRFKPGDRVVARPYISCEECYFCVTGNPHLCKQRTNIGIDKPGCFAQYITIPEKTALLVSENISEYESVMIEPLAVALRIVKKADSLIEKKVAILGAGTIGLLVLVLAKKAGAKVMVSEVFEEKLLLASNLGADIIVNVNQKDLGEEIQRWSYGIGADIVIETAGVPKTVEQAIDVVKPGGKVIIAGLSTELAKISPINIARREIKIEGSVLYVEEFTEALELVSESRKYLKQIISHNFDLSEVQQAFEVIEKKKATKVLLKM
jgi:L-gulonate 5-dehydrogenase